MNTSRPSWHTDAKWICGLILIPILTATFWLFNLYQLTNQTNAVKLMSAALVDVVAPNQKDYTEDIKKIKETIRQSPDKVFKPFPGLDIKITEQDINQYPIEELKGRLFSELAQNIYGSDSDGLSNFGALVIFTRFGHQSIGKILIYATLVSVLFLALLVYFSYDFGRLVSPGVIFILIGLPATLLMAILQKMPAGPPPPLAAGEITLWQRATSFGSAIAPTIAQVGLKNYLILTALGWFLVLTGLIGRTIQKHRSNS